MTDGRRSLADLDRTIHEPARLAIVAILSTVESADFGQLLRHTGLTRGNLSSHLSRLEQAGYVEIEKTYRGRTPRTVCRLREAGRDSFRAYRRRLRAALNLGS
jgi:DNA-binding transcriptional ArsR family regulator